MFAKITLLRVENFSAALRAFADRLFAGEVNFRQRLARRAVLRFARLGFARRELERRAAVLDHEKRLERAVVFLGNKFGEQIRLACFQHFFHLRRLDRLLQNDFASLERAGFRRARRVLAKIIHAAVKNSPAALRAFAERFLAREINRRGIGTIRIFVVAEIKLRLEVRTHFNNGGQRKALLAAETLQRSDRALADEFLDLGNFQLSTRHDFPQTEIAFLALEFFVILQYLAAAFRARHVELAVIAGHRVALMQLRLRHDVARRVGDLLH